MTTQAHQEVIPLYVTMIIIVLNILVIYAMILTLCYDMYLNESGLEQRIIRLEKTLLAKCEEQVKAIKADIQATKRWLDALAMQDKEIRHTKVNVQDVHVRLSALGATIGTLESRLTGLESKADAAEVELSGGEFAWLNL
jgi:septal ring factor EnvC (AmiA/AmiB activator)